MTRFRIEVDDRQAAARWVDASAIGSSTELGGHPDLKLAAPGTTAVVPEWQPQLGLA
ncbi:MAG: hypothetical protein OEU49_07585 [Chromatiales bacterium]|nr:hypothetical protein [Chromatiales bacterium]